MNSSPPTLLRSVCEQHHNAVSEIVHPFCSILFPEPSDEFPTEVKEPAFFGDLSLDQIVKAITAGREQYHLEAIFRSPLKSLTGIAYRQAVMRDLEDETLFSAVSVFAQEMQSVRAHLAAAKKLYYKYQAERRLLTAVETYLHAVDRLNDDLQTQPITSAGFTAFRALLRSHVGTPEFVSLRRETEQIRKDLSSIRYRLLVRDTSITVLPYEEGDDYGAIVQDVFSKFKGGKAKDYRAELRSSSEINHVEAQILDFVAKHHPEVFASLDAYFTKHQSFQNKAIARFDREVQFYLAYREYRETLKRAGFELCYPKLSSECKAVGCKNAVDLALAWKLRESADQVVSNDFFLTGSERIFIVTGPNQGGKTTFARLFGQAHYLASIGGLVSGSEASLYLPDRIYTHFEREESIATLRGGLEQELVRMHEVLSQATPASIVLINEMFASTSVADAAYLSRHVLDRLQELDLLAVCVTFLDELGSISRKTVSVVAGVAPDNPNERTHKVERRPADGLAYALAIAEKYRLTYQQLKERLRR